MFEIINPIHVNMESSLIALMKNKSDNKERNTNKEYILASCE
jgi:hypothetical protein